MLTPLFNNFFEHTKTSVGSLRHPSLRSWAIHGDYARIPPDILHTATLAADSCLAGKPPIRPVSPIGMQALSSSGDEPRPHYSFAPGDRNCEIETAVWIWPVSYYVL